MTPQFKTRIIAASLALAVMAPMPAMAKTVYITDPGLVVAAIGRSTIEIVATIKAQTASLLSAISSQTSALVLALQTHASQNTANTEKQSSVIKKVAEAQMDYSAQERYRDNAAAVEQQYGSTDPNSPEVQEACRAMSVGGSLQTAAVSKSEVLKDWSSKVSEKIMTREDPLSVSRETLKVHADNFCSSYDKERGRCSNVAPDDLQGADLKANNLFSPNETLTYGEKEELAAQTFVDSVVMYNAPTALSKKAEATPAGKAYLAAQMVEQRKQDIAAESLREIIASRKAQEETNGVSMVGVMKSYANKFLDQSWMTNLGSLSSTKLQEEQVRLTAFQVWMDYQSYLRAERTEALVAVQSLNDMRRNPSPELGALRQRALSTN